MTNTERSDLRSCRRSTDDMDQMLFNTLSAAFGRGKPEQLSALKQALQLQMSLQTLALCVAHYATRERKRLPSPQEVKLLDALASLPAPATSVAVRELYTNDPYVAYTYADMMNKRRELHPEASSPITLGEMMGLATAYLHRAGKQPRMGASPLRLIDRAASPSTDLKDCLGIADSGFSLQLGSAPAPISAGDSFLLLHRGQLPMWRYRAKLTSFLQSNEIAPQLHRVIPVKKSGLLPSLLPHCHGICFELSRLTPDGSDAPMSDLVEHFADYTVIAIPKAAADAICAAAAVAELHAIPVASAIGGERVMLRSRSGRSITVESAFLASLCARQSIAVKLPNEEELAYRQIQFSLSSNLSCPYLSDSLPAEQRAAMPNGSVAATHLRISGDFYHAAQRSVLSAVLSATLSGADLEEIRIAPALRFSRTEEGLGKATSAILGLYRAQAELGIPAATMSAGELTDGTDPELTVFALAASAALPSRLQRADSSLYCVQPALGKHRMWDPVGLRALMKQLSRLSREGKLYSARLISCETFTDALAAMSAGTRLHCRLNDPKTALDDALPFAVLLEGEANLTFSCIGQTEPASVAKVPAAYPAPDKHLVWSEQSEVTLFSLPQDHAAATLAALLQKRGADCTQCDSTTDVGRLSRAILTSRLLILCPGADLPTDERIEFSLHTQAKAGGRVILLGKQAVALPAGKPISLPNGIPIALLEDYLTGNPEKTEEK